MTMIRILTKGELQEANRQAIKAGCRAIDPAYAERLPERYRYPVLFTIPWERHDWVRCHVGTATSIQADDHTPVLIDVPKAIYDKLISVEVREEMKATQ
jgi:hypothetical protein